jgi:hypothetical protein
MVKPIGQNNLVVEIRCSLSTRRDSLGTVLQSLYKPFVTTKFLLAKLSDAVVSIRVSAFEDKPL